MKTQLLAVKVLLGAIAVSFFNCSGNKGITALEQLDDSSLVFTGIIEYNYTQLKNKNINGLWVFLASDEKLSPYNLPKSYLPNEKDKEYQYINFIGSRGEFDICYKPKNLYSAETDNILSVLDMERNTTNPGKNILQQYKLHDGKIINLGRIVVTYKGGNIENSNISYTYTFQSIGSDTLALHALRMEYPEFYDKYKNQIYIFKSKLEQNIDYVLENISEGKALMIKGFIQDHPDRIDNIFNELNTSNRDSLAKIFKGYNFDDLNAYLNRQTDLP